MKKKILFVSLALPHQVGGSETHLKVLSNELKNDGYDIYVLSLGSNKQLEMYEEGGIKYYRIGKYEQKRRETFNLIQALRYFTIELFHPSFFIFTIYLILRYRIRLVHIMTFQRTSFSPLIAAKLLSRKTFLTFHGHDTLCFFSSILPNCYGIGNKKCGSCMFKYHKFFSISERGKINNLIVQIANYLIDFNLSLKSFLVNNLVDQIIFPSNYLMRIYSKHGYNKPKSTVIYNFLQDDFRNNRINFQSFKESLKIKKGKVLIFVGNIIEEKGPQILLEAFEMIKKKYSNLKLIFIGTGSATKKLKSMASKMNYKNDVIFAGYVPHEDLSTYYGIADIVVIPSIVPEAFSFVFLESFKNKSLVIASKIGALSENITDGKNGFLVEPNNAKKLAEKIEYVLSKNHNELNLIKQNAFKNSESKFSLKNGIEKHKNLYEKIL